jgi:hypothetical protein
MWRGFECIIIVHLYLQRSVGRAICEASLATEARVRRSPPTLRGNATPKNTNSPAATPAQESETTAHLVCTLFLCTCFIAFYIIHTGCEYGNRFSWCDDFTLVDCYSDSFRDQCCDSCRKRRNLDAPGMVSHPIHNSGVHAWSFVGCRLRFWRPGVVVFDDAPVGLLRQQRSLLRDVSYFRNRNWRWTIFLIGRLQWYQHVLQLNLITCLECLIQKGWSTESSLTAGKPIIAH